MVLFQFGKLPGRFRAYDFFEVLLVERLSVFENSVLRGLRSNLGMNRVDAPGVPGQGQPLVTAVLHGNVELGAENFQLLMRWAELVHLVYEVDQSFAAFMQTLSPLEQDLGDGAEVPELFTLKRLVNNPHLVSVEVGREELLELARRADDGVPVDVVLGSAVLVFAIEDD